MTDLTSKQLLDADRDARMNASDERFLARLARGEVATPVPIVRNAMLQRDVRGMTRSAAALRRYGRTAHGLRQAQA